MLISISGGAGLIVSVGDVACIGEGAGVIRAVEVGRVGRRKGRAASLGGVLGRTTGLAGGCGTAFGCGNETTLEGVSCLLFISSGSGR